jgi:hypothetical protein
MWQQALIQLLMGIITDPKVDQAIKDSVTQFFTTFITELTAVNNTVLGDIHTAIQNLEAKIK